MDSKKVILGEVYGIKKVIELNYDYNRKRIIATMQCIFCNKITKMFASDLDKPKYTSCICRNIKHGMNRTKIYSIYANIKYRCYNSNHHEFYNYGGKGVCVCEEWIGENGFINFYKWSIDNGYKEGLSIDRIDSNGNYEPDNCRWITRSENTAFANKESQHRKSNNGTYYGITPYGEYIEFDNANKFAREHDMNSSKIRYTAHKLKDNKYNGWEFGFVNNKKDYKYEI